MNHTNLPADPGLAASVVKAQAEQDKVKLERGVLGILFGTKDNVPHNVAGFIAVGGLVSIAIILSRASSFEIVKDQVAVLSSMTTLALGFLFGKASKD